MTCPPEAGEHDKREQRRGEGLTPRAGEELSSETVIGYGRIRHAAFLALLRNDYKRSHDEAMLRRLSLARRRRN
jgi:hypothetical protein